MEAKDFLEKNGFKYHKIYDYWYNENCTVAIGHSHYCISSAINLIGKEGFMYSNDLNIYWLIGVLTYYGLIDKNYKQ